MCQRGAIARALAMGAPVLLMDEPFGALDPVNRTRLQDLLLEVWNSSRPARTIVFVTHDVDEAILLADRVVVLGACQGESSRIWMSHSQAASSTANLSAARVSEPAQGSHRLLAGRHAAAAVGRRHDGGGRGI